MVVSMFTGSMSPMGMNSAYGNGGNVHQNLKGRYGVGYEDFGSRPYAQPYPHAIVPREPVPALEHSWLGRFFKRCFLT